MYQIMVQFIFITRNPYILTKPTGILVGHNNEVISIVIHHEKAKIISMSSDNVLKVWLLAF